VPVLGICYGMQVMAAQLGGYVESAKKREFGYAELIIQDNKLFGEISDRTSPEGQAALDVWMSHGDNVVGLPKGFKVIAYNAATPIAAMADETRQFYGLQFHPEVTHTLQGKAIIEHFVHNICAAGYDWNMPDYVEESISRIRQRLAMTK